MFYITQSGQIYSGDPQNNDRQLTDKEAELIRSGHYSIINNQVVDTTTLPGYSQNQRINEINLEIEDIYKELDNWDLKSIRALREGGVLEDGTTYLEFYQSKINELRGVLSSLTTEKNSLQSELDLLNNGGSEDDIAE